MSFAYLIVPAASTKSAFPQVMPSGPRKLGGDRGLMRDLPPGLAAAMAAERRAADDKWCAGAATAQNESDEAGVRATQEAERGGGVAGETSGPGGGDARQRRGVTSAMNGDANGVGGASTSGSERGAAGTSKAREGLGGVGQGTGSAGVERTGYPVGGLDVDPVARTAGKGWSNGRAGGAEALAAAAERRKRKQAGGDEEAGRGWACSVCTLENDVSSRCYFLFRFTLGIKFCRCRSSSSGLLVC